MRLSRKWFTASGTLMCLSIILASVLLVTEVRLRMPHLLVPTAAEGAAGKGERSSTRTLRRFAHAL
jgi:hypothetical protein